MSSFPNIGSKAIPFAVILHDGLKKYSEDQARDYHGRFSGEGDAASMSRDQYTGGWKPDETDDQRQERRDKEQVWEQKTLAAVSEGKLDPAMAEARGAGLNVSGKVFQPLPDVPLYHVTTAADAVIANGLKSRFELNMGQGTGLGGGDDKSISFAADPKIGGDIRDAMLEAHDVANGKISVQDMLDQATKGEGAPSPYLTNVIRWGSSEVAPSPNWNPGDPYPMGLDALIHGKELSPSKFGGATEEDMPGWTPRSDSYSWMGGDDKMRYNTFERPMSADELRNRTFDFYKTFSAVREDAGGRLNPLFFSSDLKAFASTPKDQIQLLEFKKVPGAMGVSLSAGGLGEWRTYSGKAVKYVGRVTKAKLIELVKYSEDQARVPAGSPGGGQFVSGGGESWGDVNLEFMPVVRSDADLEHAAKPFVGATPEDYDKHLVSTPIEGMSKLGGGVSDTRVVYFDDGTKGVFKPDSGEAKGMRYAITDGKQSAREAGAWEVAKAAGMTDMVAPATIRTIDGEKGVVLDWQNGEVARSLPDVKAYDGNEDLARAAAFDYVIGNEDRHNGNWIVSDNGKLKLIDHGLSFPDRLPYDSGGNGMFIDEAFERFDSPRAQKFVPADFAEPYQEAWPKIQERLRAVGLPEKSIAGVEDRILTLANTDKWEKLAHTWR
jgi:hypothetical protein